MSEVNEYDPGVIAAENLMTELQSRRADSKQLARFVALINEATGVSSDFEAALNLMVRHSQFAQAFLKTFAPYVENDEPLPCSFAVDRIVEFVNALKEAK